MLALGIISLVFSLIAISVSIYVYRKTKAVTTYSNIDRLYFDLLNMGIEHPDFVNPDYTQDYEKRFVGNQKIQYELYAFNAWNICETIYDRRKDSGVFESWKPVLENENALHRRWFDRPANKMKFKASFVTYVNEAADEDGNKIFPHSDRLLT